MALKLSNNAISSLASSITAGSTSITLKTGDGAKFPTLGAGDYHQATISKSDGSLEIVRVTARSGDTLTVTRAQEGTTALAFDAGSLIELRLTAAVVESLVNPTTVSSFTNDAGYLTSETDPVFNASPAKNITSTNITNWNTAYGWGNHASAGYLTSSTAATTYQPLDADLTSIAGLAGTSGLLKKTAANTWTLDTSAYLTGNQTVTLSGDATGSGTTSIALTLANSGVTAGTYPKVTVDAKGRVTAGASLSASDVPTLNQNTTGSAATLTTGRTIGMTGDVTYTSGSFNGSANVTGTATLANSGVTAGTYTKVTVDAKGRATSGTTLSASDIPALDASKITSGVLDAARLPSYVDDVLEYANLAGFPATGEQGKIYVALDTNKTYRWSGSAYVYITSGAVDSVAGKTGVVTLVKGDVGLGNVENTALSTWAGTSNITTLGTIATGTWNATTISLAKGGTGATDAATARTNLGVAIGSNVQAWDADLDAIAALAGTSGFLKKTAANTWSLDTNTYLTGITSGQVTTALGYTPYNSTNPNGYTTNTGTVTSVATSGAITGGTITTTGTISHSTADGYLHVPATSTTNNGNILVAGATAGSFSWQVPSLTLIPDAWVKKSVRCATTANITLSGTQTIDGIAVVAGDRVLVKDQTAGAENGIYVASATAWARATDADAIGELAGACVNVDSGTVNGGKRFDTDLKVTDTLGTTAVTFYRVLDLADAATANTANTVVLRDASGNFTAGTITAALSGNASTATALTTGRTIGMTGDVTWTSASFNGSANVTGTATLANSGVTASTYKSVTVDEKGRVTAGTNPTTLSGYGITDALALSGGALTGGLREAKVAMAANDISLTSGNVFTKTISGATTLTVSNVPATGTAATFILDLTNGGAGTITWWTGVKWAAGTAPTLTASGRDILGFFTHDGGTTWSGLVLGKDVK